MSFPGKILSNKTMDSAIKMSLSLSFYWSKELVAERQIILHSSLFDSVVVHASLKDFLGKLNTLTKT